MSTSALTSTCAASRSSAGTRGEGLAARLAEAQDGGQAFHATRAAGGGSIASAAPLSTIAQAEQPPRRRGGQQVADRHRARRLAEDRDVQRVAAEGADVVTHPAQRGDLVEQPPVGEPPALVVGERRVGEKTECSEPVVEGDNDDAAGGQPTRPVHDPRPAAVGEGPAVDEDHHRQGPAVLPGTRRCTPGSSRPARRDRRGSNCRCREGLRRDRPERRGVSRYVPRRAPAAAAGNAAGRPAPQRTGCPGTTTRRRPRPRVPSRRRS